MEEISFIQESFNSYDDTFTWIIPDDDEKILLKDQLAKETDILVICASYEWIPPIYHPLILNWQTICEEVIGQEYPFDSF